MLLTEEHVHSSVPQSRSERQRYIVAQEKAWLSLSWDRKRYTNEAAKSALTLLSAIAFSDHRDPIDLSLLSDDGMSSGASSSRGTKRPATALSPDTDDAGRPTNSGSPSGAPASTGGPNSERPASTSNGKDNGSAPKESKKPKSKRAKLTSTIIPPDTQVACLDRSMNEYWVLGRVSRYLPELKKYEVLDDDDGENVKYNVFKRNIRVIPKRAQTFDQKKRVLAVYPMTTVFYPARLVSRRGKNWTVEFEDEDDQESAKFKEVDGRFIIQE